MASRTNIAQTNNIVYVEPNYAYSIEGYDTGGLENFEFIPNTEDYSIYVNLEIETIGRTIQTGNRVFRFTYTSKGGDESVNLMGGSKIYTTDGNSINSLTTNYTNYHITDINGVGASPELFGINYIDIAYNHFMVPEVTIEFVDVRGASVFGQREAFETNNAERAIRGNYKDDVVNTFFQCFFTFPYPKFTLVVKGFYGDPVSYELTCADFRARFNSDTGNFSCTAKFVGYYFSFLNDAMLNALIAAPFSDFLGAEYWKQQAFKLKGINGGEVDLPTLGYLLKVMKNAEAAAEQISQSSPEVQEKTNVEQLSEAYSTIKRLYQTYVKAIADLVKTKTLDDGIELFISDMTDNNISSAAIILVPKTAENETFEAHFSENGTTPVTDAYNALTGQISSFTSEYTSISFPTLNNFASASTKQRIFQVDGDTTKCIVDSNHVNDDIKNRSRNLYNAFEKKVLNQNKDNETNKYVQTMWAYFYDDNGFMDSLDSAMKKLSDREKELTKSIASSKADALAKRLGFKPSVENVTRILMAHFQTFAYMIFKTARMIDAEDPKRDTKKLGITDDDDIADVPEKYRSAEGYLLVPPFPNVTKLVEKNGIKNREESWVGEYGNKFKETDLVHGILNGIEEFVKLVSAGENAGSAGSTSSVNAVMSHPLSPLDLVLTKNIYAEFDQNEVSSLLSLVGLRALQILGLTNFDNWDKNCEVLGAAEAENLLKTEKLSNDLKNLLKNLKDNVDPIIEMLKGKPTSDIQKPSSGVWPWQESTESVGIIGNDGEFNICKADGVKGSTTYCLPIQGLDWNKIKREVIHSKSAYASDDYFNISQTLIENSYKDNIFNIETNINRVKNICERQLETPEGIKDYKEKFLKEATYKSSDYESLFYDPSMFVKANYKYVLAYPIDGADKLLPSDSSCMIPCTTSYIKQMTWGGGYNMDDFHKFNPSSDWKDKDNNEVRRKGEDGYKDFFNDLDTNKYTLTEIPGLTKSLDTLTQLDTCPETSLFTQELYYLQNDDRVKGFMLLCSLNYLYEYVKIFKSELCNKDKTISIIPLPAVIFAGGILWATKDANKAKFKGGCLPESNTIKLCKGELDKLDPQILLKFEKTFEKWINEGVMNNDIIVSFKEIKSNLELKLLNPNITYEQFFNSLGEMEKKTWIGTTRTWFKEGIFEEKGYNDLLDFFAGEFGESFFRNYICIDEDLGGNKNEHTIGMRVGNRDGSVGIKQYVDFALAPCLFMKNSKFFLKDTPKVLKVETGNLKSFFKGFLNRICEEETQETEDNSVSQAREPQTTDDIKVGVYRYCKLLYDKWIGGISDTDFEQYTMKEFFDNDTKYFHFIDAYYNYANELTINIGRFCDMVKESYANADYSLLSFMSSVYSENKFSFHCIQNFLDLSRRENMMRMFDLVPYTEIKWDKIKKHPNFVVNYAYEASSHLDIEGDEYENDSFMVNQAEGIGNKWPEALKSRHAGETKGLNVPAFGVSYGKMYQSYFKDVSISMDNPTVTEQSIKAQFAIACQNNEQTSQPDESKQYTYGQDLYSVYSNNSYECDVTMMGCAWVQPLMLFVLNNVPMFRGTYQIINVTHHIEQGDMTTKFKGVRMANVTTRIVENNCVSSTSDQTDAGVNTEINQESAYASDDNDCAYVEYPITVEGVAGGGMPESFLNANYKEFCGGDVFKYEQWEDKKKTKKRYYGEKKDNTAYKWLTDSSRTVGEVLCAAIAAEYAGFTQNNSLMLKVASAMVCNKYHWCKKNNSWVYLFGTLQQGTGNGAAHGNTYDKYKDIVMPIFINGPGSLVGEIAKVKEGCNVEMWSYGKTEHKKAPSTHAITEDDMRSVFAYCTMGGYDYEHIGQYPEKVGKQNRFETKDIPNNGKSMWKKAKFLFQEFNSVFTSCPDRPDEKYWDPAPPVVNNGDEKVSKLANGFLHALNQTSTSSSVGVEIGIDKEKSNGNTIYLTNAKDSQNFGKVLDMMLQAYSSKIEEIRWLVPGENGNQSLPPAAYIVTLKEGSTYTLVKVVNESNNELVSEISMENEGGINTDFRKAIVKKYKDETNKVEKVGKYVLPAMSKETIEKLFNENEIKNCNSVRSNEAPSTESSNTPMEGPATTSNWDVNAFVKNLHYWQANTCEEIHAKNPKKGIRKSPGGSCGVCTGVINRALRDTGFGMKYWGEFPWNVYNSMKSANSDFSEIDSGESSSKVEFNFKYNPLAGDICTMWSKPDRNLHFHTCAFDGKKWVSDFVQLTCNVYRSSKKPSQMEFHVFRHK